MKKLVLFLCTGALVMGLASCGGNGNEGQGSSLADGSASESFSVESPAPENAGNIGQPASDPSGENSPEGSAESSGSAGDGHNYEEGWTEEMEAVRTAVVEAAGDNYFPNSPILPELLEERFGITTDMYDDYFGEMPMISANVDTILVVKAKEGQEQAVEEALNAYRDSQINDTMQYPKNVGIVQASRIERLGNYVCFVQLGGDVTEALESGEEAVIQHCQELNDLVIEAIGQQQGS